MAIVVKVIGAADGRSTPHDGRYVKDWNPHTKFGVLELTSTNNIKEARRFENGDEFREWVTISKVQPRRPTDGKPNKPLTGITVETFDPDNLQLKQH